MSLEGEIRVRLLWDGHRIARVAVAASRPLAAPRVLSGRTPAEALSLVPALYALCGRAQGAAAQLALEHAGAELPGAPEPEALRNAVWLETLGELFWRLLLDWPEACGMAGQHEPVAAARRVVLAAPAHVQDPAGLLAALGALAAEHVFAEAPQAWLARQSPADFTAWLAATDTPPAQALRRLWDEVACPGRGDAPRCLPDDVAKVCAALADPMALPEFARHPRWAGADAETGALARQRDTPLLAALLAERGADAAVRLVARLRELALLLTEGLPAAWLHGRALPGPDGTGVGVGAVQTARGLLLHRAQLVDGRVADYAVLAPTEWNFAADGALVRALAHRACASEAEARAATRLMVQALDPCVACSVEFEHA
jgi:hypothetical protein